MAYKAYWQVPGSSFARTLQDMRTEMERKGNGKDGKTRSMRADLHRLGHARRANYSELGGRAG